MPGNPLHQWVEARVRPCYPKSPELPPLGQALRHMLSRGQGLLDQHARGRIEEARAGLSAIDTDAAEIEGLLRALERRICEN